MAPPHSATVRGTLSNPKRSEAKSNGTPKLGDPTSVEGEKADSAPKDDVPMAESYSETESKLPHSKTVRGTLGSSKGPEVNKSMLGDPTSMKAEKSDNDRYKGAGDDEANQRAADKRGSKL